MTTELVVDASAIAAMLFDEPERDEVRVHTKGAVLHAPNLIQSELANVCAKKARRDPINRDRYVLALCALPAFDIRLHPIEVPVVAALAIGRNISGYDASYYWLAREQGLGLVTLDARLKATFAAP
ncbi:MAG: type II toxin-antitoxin system VapC family toxin [Rhizomicrobium sp.]